jgi:hypothetical protein
LQSDTNEQGLNVLLIAVETDLVKIDTNIELVDSSRSEQSTAS